MEVYRKAWKLSSLIKEDRDAELEISRGTFHFISLKKYFIILSGLIILLFLINKIDKEVFSFTFESYFLIMLIASFLVLINNFIAKKQKLNKIIRREKIKALESELSDNKSLKNNTSVRIDLELNRKKYIKETKNLGKGLKIYAFVLLIIYIVYEFAIK